MGRLPARRRTRRRPTMSTPGQSPVSRHAGLGAAAIAERPRLAPGARGSASRPTGWSLTPGGRKLVLAAHIVVSVGLLGISTAMLVLGTVAATTADLATAQAAYRSMGIFTRGVIQPMALGALVTGVILSL